MLSGMAYPFWFAISPYLLMGQKKQEPFVRFHAIQAVVVGSIATMITLLILIIGAFLFSSAPSVSTRTSTERQEVAPAPAETAVEAAGTAKATGTAKAPPKPTYLEEALRETTPEVNVRNDAYMNQGCFSIGLFSGMMLIVSIEFIFIMFCAYKAWSGVFYSIPFIGKFIEDKYFVEFSE